MSSAHPTNWTSRSAPTLFALAVALAGFWCFTRHNDFAFYYHSDEPGKVEQVITGDYNFHHPMLLLSASEAVLGLTGGEEDLQRVVEAGRAASALFGAIAAAALALLAWVRAGWIAGVATGMLLVFNQQLFELAHYMKEDPALLVGFALMFLTLEWHRRVPTAWSALACGAACGVAVSGKYLGALAIPCALVVILLNRGGGRRIADVALLLAGAAAVFVAFNLPLLRDLGGFESSFSREVDFVVHGSKGMTRSVPHAVYLNIFADNTTPVIWLMLGAFYWSFWRNRRDADVVGWILAVFPILLTIFFSFSPKTNDRYYLPVTAVLYLLAAIGIVRLATELLPRRWAAFRGRETLTAVALIVIALAVEAPRIAEVNRAFQHDDRRELVEYIERELPASAKIAQDRRVMLPDERNRNRGRVLADLPQQIESGKRYASELGDLDALRAGGFTHVAVTESNYGRFFLKSLRARDEYKDEHSRQRAFYERLFAEGELLFEREGGTVIYLHPGLRLYRIVR